MATEIKTKVVVEGGAPFKVELEMRAGLTPLFQLTSIDRPLDAAWIPELMKMLSEAKKVADLLDDSGDHAPSPRRK
jgi:hypothetical protein